MISGMTGYEIETRTLTEQDTAVEYATLPIDEIGAWLAKAFSEVARYLGRKGAGPAGMPSARYSRRDDGRFDVEAGFPASTPTNGEGDVEPSDLPAGPAAVTVHVGPYGEIQPAYAALQAWILERGGVPEGHPSEVYFDDPNLDHDPTTWRTEVIQPYRPKP